MKILVTAFDPFGGEKMNPALEAVKQLDDTIGDHSITKLEIPTVFHESKEVISKALAENDFDVVLAIGQAEVDLKSHLNVLVLTLMMHVLQIIKKINLLMKSFKRWPTSLLLKFTCKKMTEAIQNAGVPGRLSNTAGTFVCNHVLYQLGYLADKSYPGLRFGFIHVPFIPEQTINKPDKPSMSIHTIVKGLTAAIKAIDTLEDKKSH